MALESGYDFPLRSGSLTVSGQGPAAEGERVRWAFTAADCEQLTPVVERLSLIH